MRLTGPSVLHFLCSYELQAVARSCLEQACLFGLQRRVGAIRAALGVKEYLTYLFVFECRACWELYKVGVAGDGSCVSLFLRDDGVS